MAEKKTTAVKATTTKKPAVKKTAQNVKAAKTIQTPEQMKTELETKQQDLLAARRGLAAGELVNPRVITTTKKEIARLHTAIRAAELQEQKENK